MLLLFYKSIFLKKYSRQEVQQENQKYNFIQGVLFPAISPDFLMED